MSSYRSCYSWTVFLFVLLAVLPRTPVVGASSSSSQQDDDDLSFEVPDEIVVQVAGKSPSSTVSTSSTRIKKWNDSSSNNNNNKFVATVGRDFHWIVPKETFGKSVQTYEAKKQGGKPLPSWLLFDKTDGILWGVPLLDDVGVLHITIKSTTDKKTKLNLEINVVERNADTTAVLPKCLPNEDTTVLILLLDKPIKAIKPKQRVIAINNIAKFFAIHYSAFELLQTQTTTAEVEDLTTDSSIILAGPGTDDNHSKIAASYIQVPVGCDGRLWLSTAPLIHQLKAQARDGTISEVLRLPLIGWRVKTLPRRSLRNRRQTDSDYGSGDYEEYYEDYEEDYTDLDGTPKTTTITSTATTITRTSSSESTTPIVQSSTHPHHHRHHHGESKLNESDTSSSVLPLPNNNNEDDFYITPELIMPPAIPTISSTTTTEASTSSISSTSTVVVPPPKTEDSYDYNYDYDETDDEDGKTDVDGPPESATILPTTRKFGTSTSGVNTTTVSSTNIFTTTTTTEAAKHVIVEEEEEEVPIPTEREQTEETTLPPHVVVIQTNPPPPETTTLYNVIEDTEPPVETVTEIFTIPPTTTTSTIIPTTISTTTPPPPTISTTTTLLEEKTTMTIVQEPEPDTTTTIKLTTLRHITSTPPSTATSMVTRGEPTEFVEIDVKNFPPYIENRLRQMHVIAGKVLQFIIPYDTFRDFEDKYNLTVEVLDAQGEPLSEDSWLQFNRYRKEIYGLPLEKDVSKWEYIIRATDREGGRVDDILKISVQQHKSQRTVNYEFTLHVRIEDKSVFSNYVDWSLKVLRTLGKLYHGDPTSISEITVRNIDYLSEPVKFTYTNDSVSTKYCPKSEIETLFNVIKANNVGDPSEELSQLLSPELRVKKVEFVGLGVCDFPQVLPTPKENFSPAIRNHVDIIKATVGELLIFAVPEDTFYDPEEQDSRALNVTLLTVNRQPLPPESWLQFDSSNREFYGIPWRNGSIKYQLVCTDSGGLSATDSLVVDTSNPPKTHFNVEFGMTIVMPHSQFTNSAATQRKFVEKLLEVFEDVNPKNVRFLPFKQKHNSTIITWFNTSLPRENCSHSEIKRFESLVHDSDNSIANRVHNIMKGFPVSTIKIVPYGNCKVRPKATAPPIRTPTHKVLDDESVPQPSSNDYLITCIVPAVIISIMLLLASVAACILYRRRRSGKLNIDENSRQNYGNKGIPVIFQEELEEKPESGTKTPVILKDEKPPLAPPEYSKSGSLKFTDDSEPYQPPPPFTRTQDNNGKQARPKPTPTYRKPPPYVPP